LMALGLKVSPYLARQARNLTQRTMQASIKS